MTGKSEAEQDRRRLYERIGQFLFDHRLEPSPANYMLVHMLVTGSNASAVAAVEEATEDGLRLSQDEADRILAMIGEAPPAPPSPAADAAIKEVRRQMDDFAGIVDTTRAEVKVYGRDLKSGAAQLAAAAGAESIAELIRVTGTMIERTRAAEGRLEAATGEARALRARLASAEEEARRDPLTGLPNRRAFGDRFAALSNEGTPFAVALCDIDRFKRINDSHGHAVGDRVLKTVASILQQSCEGATVARYGGEEFAILFPAKEAAAAAAIVDAAREAVAERQFTVRETDAPLGRVAFSAGVVAAAKGEAYETIMQRADALLYKAKHEGRNRVETEPSA
ncbi:GGDEF domain-containing protein [Sphingosinicella humi]|uniref:diguanylate cyclase n=1 Tax=Allosphingosinicella humi TaxID=2068657 RepID=A0A2U2J1E8_9SPHN|nr:GGDEF domain-containing protein [Sphingosinicella humi]PWG02157.1 GGDEF domain-containing protein [Sphingosinicella humi]